jgi:drug/metabolite transporter (DMT)-like permease
MVDGMHRPSGRTGLGLALTLATVALWAVLPIGLKVLLGGLDPMTITWFRFSAAAVMLFAILRARGTIPDLRGIGAGQRNLLLVANLALAGNYGFYVLGLERTGASTAQVVIQIAPMLLTVGGIVVFRERFTRIQWMGLAVLIAGLVVFSSDRVGHMTEGVGRFALGLVFMIVAAVTWAAYGLAQKQLLTRMTAPSVMLCIYIGASMIFLPLASPAGLLDLDAVQLGALAFCTLNMLLAYATFSEALAHWEASRVSALLATVPLATLAALAASERLFPNLVAPEPVSRLGLAGAVMVVAGSGLVALARADAEVVGAPPPAAAAPPSDLH